MPAGGSISPPSLPQGSLQEGEPTLGVSQAWLSVLSVPTSVFVVQLESDLLAGLWGFCKLGLYRALPQAGGEASVACARLRHGLFALFFFSLMSSILESPVIEKYFNYARVFSSPLTDYSPWCWQS